MPWARWKIVANQSDAAEAAEAFGYPVVLKVAGRKLFHRSETGGVVANVTTASLDRAFSQIALIAKEYGDAVMVQEQAKPGFEIMLSVLDNPEFGLVAVLRPGGVLAELMNAQVILSTQWPAERRIEILRRSKLGRILNGYRGGKRYDLVALAELAHNAMRLVETTDLQFVEFNPVILGPEGAAVVDAIARRQ